MVLHSWKPLKTGMLPTNLILRTILLFIPLQLSENSVQVETVKGMPHIPLGESKFKS